MDPWNSRTHRVAKIRGQIWYPANGYSGNASGVAGCRPQRFRPGRSAPKRELENFSRTEKRGPTMASFLQPPGRGRERDGPRRIHLPRKKQIIFCPRRVLHRLRFGATNLWIGKSRLAHLHISGWCVTTYGEPIMELRARLGGHIFPAKYGIPRPEIALAFEGQPSALRSGFSAEVTVPRRGGTFVLEGRSQNGVWKQIFSRRLGNRIFARKRAGTSEPISNCHEW